MWQSRSMEPITVACFCHDSCCLPYFHVTSEFIFYKTVLQHIGRAMFSDINISQGSVVAPLRCGGICTDLFVANFLASLIMKEFWKSVNIWRSYGQEFGVLFVWLTVYITVVVVVVVFVVVVVVVVIVSTWLMLTNDVIDIAVDSRARYDWHVLHL